MRVAAFNRQFFEHFEGFSEDSFYRESMVVLFTKKKENPWIPDRVGDDSKQILHFVQNDN